MRILRPLRQDRRQQHGGAAIEYVIVSTFATLLAVGAIVFVGKAMKSKLQTMEQKLGVSFDNDVFQLF